MTKQNSLQKKQIKTKQTHEEQKKVMMSIEHGKKDGEYIPYIPQKINRALEQSTVTSFHACNRELPNKWRLH